LSDIKLPAGVVLSGAVAGKNPSIVAVHVMRAEEIEAPVAVAEGAVAAVPVRFRPQARPASAGAARRQRQEAAEPQEGKSEEDAKETKKDAKEAKRTPRSSRKRAPQGAGPCPAGAARRPSVATRQFHGGVDSDWSSVSAIRDRARDTGITPVLVVHRLAQRYGGSLRPHARYHGDVGRLTIEGRELWLLKQ